MSVIDPRLSMSFHVLRFLAISVQLSPLGMDGSWAKAPGNTSQVRKAVSKCSLQSASAGAWREAELGRCQNASWRPKIWNWFSINGYYCNLCDKPGSVQPPTLLFRHKFQSPEGGLKVTYTKIPSCILLSPEDCRNMVHFWTTPHHLLSGLHQQISTPECQGKLQEIPTIKKTSFL